MRRKLRMGMVGGGRDAFIGAVHRMAAALDGQIELVCGAFCADPQKSRLSGEDLFLDPRRVYGTYEEMMRKEKSLPEGERMDFVSIVTPNHLHFPVAQAALQNGFPVVCDKPMTVSLAEARELQALVRKTGLPFALTHNYTGYPMVKEARQRIRSGQLGEVRKVVVSYPQGWLSTPLEASGHKQASWRMDPERSGPAGCMGDIGTHCENLAEYITGLQIEELCADLTTFVPGRRLDDDGAVLLRFKGGARGILHASQIASGEENAIAISVYGTKGGLEWHQQEPNSLVLKWPDRPLEVVRAGKGFSYLSKAALAATRLPSGHPEGSIEAFAVIYRNFASVLRARLEGRQPEPEYLDFPTVDDGVRGMAFIETVLESSRSAQKWLKLTLPA